MKHIQQHVLRIQKRVWKHKQALYNIDKCIKQLENCYLSISIDSLSMVLFIHELRMIRIHEYFEYKAALRLLKNEVIYTA